MTAVLRQVKASQGFLKQVRHLQNFDQLRQKQHVLLKAVLGKTSGCNADEARHICEALDNTLWTKPQVDQVLTAVAALPSTEVKKGQLQDYTMFVVFLTQTQWAELERCVDIDQVSVKVLRYLAGLGLRHPTEPTLGNLLVFCYVFLGMQLPDPESFQAELETFKPAARRLLSAHGQPAFHLQGLPSNPAALPVQVAQAVFATEGPSPGKVTAEHLFFAARRVPLRKTSAHLKKAEKEVDPVLGALGAFMHRVSHSSGSGLARPPPAPRPAQQPLAILDRDRLLAIQDRPCEEPPTEEANQIDEGRVVEEQADVETGEGHVLRLQKALSGQSDEAAEPRKRPAMKRPCARKEASEADEEAAAPSPMKRPSARKEASEADEEAAVSDDEKPVVLASPPRAKAKGKAAFRRPAAAAALKRPAAAAPAGRQAVKGMTWEERLEARPAGCAKCRRLPGCTPSCFK